MSRTVAQARISDIFNNDYKCSYGFGVTRVTDNKGRWTKVDTGDTIAPQNEKTMVLITLSSNNDRKRYCERDLFAVADSISRVAHGYDIVAFPTRKYNQDFWKLLGFTVEELGVSETAMRLTQTKINHWKNCAKNPAFDPLRVD